MKLKFEVDQAEAFRRGVNASSAIVTVEVDPAALTANDRNLIADRLSGSDVYALRAVEAPKLQKGNSLLTYEPKLEHRWFRGAYVRIIAKAPTFDSLMEAIKANDVEVQKELAELKRNKRKVNRQ